MSLRGKCAIVGLGVTPMGRIYGRSGLDFAVEAVKLALDDAGLKKEEVDGVLMNGGFSSGLSPQFQNTLGLRDLTLINEMNAYGSTIGTMVQYATMAIDAGLANVVVLVFSDAPLSPTRAASDAYGTPRNQVTGMASLGPAYGQFGANTGYALACRRHMHLYGTTSEQLGAIAVSQRAWALMNPWAQMRRPITLEDHQNSRFIVDPLRLLDCCIVSNGAVAVIITSSERARTLRQPPSFILGYAQACPGENLRTDREPAVHTGAVLSGQKAFKMAGVTANDVDVREFYDCYTYTVLVTLEDYGFCKKGEGGAFVEDGKLGPRGSLPTNTGGGQLSAYYMWGMTPLSEAVVQSRGQGGERQAKKHDVVLVSGNGGILNYHSTVILGTQPS